MTITNDIMADTLKKYVCALECFDNFDSKTKKRIIKDLIRDISAVAEFFKTLQ